MFGLGGGEILLILVLALVFIGPKKIPELAKGLGKGLREFQKAKDDLFDSVHDEGHSGPDRLENVENKTEKKSDLKPLVKESGPLSLEEANKSAEKVTSVNNSSDSTNDKDSVAEKSAKKELKNSELT